MNYNERKINSIHTINKGTAPYARLSNIVSDSSYAEYLNSYNDSKKAEKEITKRLLAEVIEIANMIAAKVKKLK